MSLSLVKLAANLPVDSFKYTSQVFKDEKLALMKQNGVYLYDYMSSFEKFNDKQFPTKDDFYNQLIDEDITDEA